MTPRDAKILADAQAVRRDLDGLRLQLARFPLCVRPFFRWVVEKTRALMLWIERGAKP